MIPVPDNCVGTGMNLNSREADRLGVKGTVNVSRLVAVAENPIVAQ